MSVVTLYSTVHLWAVQRLASKLLAAECTLHARGTHDKANKEQSCACNSGWRAIGCCTCAVSSHNCSERVRRL